MLGLYEVNSTQTKKPEHLTASSGSVLPGYHVNWSPGSRPKVNNKLGVSKCGFERSGNYY